MPKVTTLSARRQDMDPVIRPRPTMRDVAALAGVSLKTVSRVINAEPAVSVDLLARVERAIEQLDYRHNLTASSLRRVGGKTATVGLVLEDLANPYSAAVTRAVEDAARPRRVTVVAGSVDEDPERERALVHEFVARRVDGLIVAPTAADQSYLLAERRAGTAFVFVDRPPNHLDADAVVAANRAGRPRASDTSSRAVIAGSASSATWRRSRRPATASPVTSTQSSERALLSTPRSSGAICEVATRPGPPSRSFSTWRNRRPRSLRPRTSSRSVRSPRSAVCAASSTSPSSALTTSRSRTSSIPV